MRKEYRKLLSTIAHKINAEELETMKFLCADFIPFPESLQTQPNSSCLREVFGFFRKLEAQDELDIDKLDLMQDMLTHLKKEDLALEVTGFQFQRRVYLSSLNASERESERNQTTRRSQQEENQEEDQTRRSEPEVREEQQAAVGSQTSKGTILMKCAPYIAGGAWVVGSAYILNLHKKDPKALVNMVTKVVLPTGTLVRSIFSGSINFLLQTTDLNSLQELWKRYQSGRLKEDLQKVMVTEELKNLANGEPIDLVVKMSEEEYRNACLDLMVAQTKAQTLCKGIISSEPVRRASRSLPDLTSLDTPDDLSRDLLLAQLSDDLKRRKNARKVEKIQTNLSSSGKNVVCLLQQINSIQYKIKSLEVSLGKSYPDLEEHGMSSYRFEMEREVHDELIRTNLTLSNFETLLEEMKHFFKNGQFLLFPEESVRRLGTFVVRLQLTGPDQSTSWHDVFEKLDERLSPYSDAENKSKDFVISLISELKEMAALLVKVFNLDQELLKAKPKYIGDTWSSSDDGDDDDDDNSIKRRKLSRASLFSPMTKYGKEAPVQRMQLKEAMLMEREKLKLAQLHEREPLTPMPKEAK